MIYSNLDRLFMLSRKCHTFISPARWLTFNILSVMSRSHFFSHDPFLSLRSWFIGTPFDTTRLHPFIHDPFTFFQLRFVHTYTVTIRLLLLVTTRLQFFLSQPIWNLSVTTICTHWSRPVSNFSVTIHSQPSGHDHLQSFKHDHLHHFDHNPFARFRSKFISCFRS